MKPRVEVYDYKERPPTETPDGTYRIDITIDPAKMKDGKDPRQSEIAQWLADQIASFHEANNVVESYKHNANPDKMSAQDVNRLMIRVRGKPWGKWKDQNSIQGLDLSTGDLIDQTTFSNSYFDHVAINAWYLEYRKRCLKLALRYAEEPELTIESFRLMTEKIQEESAASIPKPTALISEAKGAIREAESRPDQITKLLHRTLEAKEALFTAMNDLGESVAGFKKLSDEYSRDLHAFKASVIHDISTAKREMSDVRKFFLEKEHVTEIERLKEFIGLCEKLRELKNDGTLDAIANTILKLEGA